MPSLQDIYNSAKQVESMTGIDPAIITAIAATEWGSNFSGQPTSLGITTAAPAGRGVSGGAIHVNAQSGQPAGFWTYETGAEAAIAFRHYIENVFPHAAPSLGSATSFFNAMKGTNYDVVYNNPSVGPASGRNTAAETAYWDQHIHSALQFVQQFDPLSGNAIVPVPVPGPGIQIPGISQEPTPGSVTPGPSSSTSSGIPFLNTPAGKISMPTGLMAVLLGVALLIVGAILAFVGFEKPSVTVKTFKAQV